MGMTLLVEGRWYLFRFLVPYVSFFFLPCAPIKKAVTPIVLLLRGLVFSFPFRMYFNRHDQALPNS